MMLSHRTSQKPQKEEQRARSRTGKPDNRKAGIPAFGSCLLCLVSCFLAAGSFARYDAFAQAPRSTEVSLYFLDTKELKLIAESRTISQVENTLEQIKLTIAELIEGPTWELIPTIPEETEVREVFLDEKGCVYVDFSRAISQNHSGGTTGELVTISSIVNTLTANFPEEIQKVRILIDGREAKTIAGHIDISRPIFPFELK